MSRPRFGPSPLLIFWPPPSILILISDLATMSNFVDLCHSSDSDDEVVEVFLTAQVLTAQVLNMWVPQAPCSKPSVSYGPGRGRWFGTYRCYINTEAKNKMKLFGSAVKAVASQVGFEMIPRNKPVVLYIYCLLRRPDEDFVGRRREANNLRVEKKENAVLAIKPDNDNLAKFLLDSVTGVLVADDAQFVHISIVKLRDNEGLCEGRVGIHCRQFTGHYSELMPTF
jgi:Holliday junction resolvase RusA-like endonuclease